MPESMPASLVAAFAALMCFAMAQTTHGAHFRGTSSMARFSVQLSSIAAADTALVFLVYYGYWTAWYWPLVLFGIGWAFSAAVTCAALPRCDLDTVPTRSMAINTAISVIGFVGWPLSAWIAFQSVPALG